METNAVLVDVLALIMNEAVHLAESCHLGSYLFDDVVGLSFYTLFSDSFIIGKGGKDSVRDVCLYSLWHLDIYSFGFVGLLYIFIVKVVIHRFEVE